MKAEKQELKKELRDLKKDKSINRYTEQLKRILLYFVAAFGYKRPIFNLAKQKANEVGKPLLNAGCGSKFTGLSDVNLDIVSKEVPNFVKGDIQNLLMFRDKQFGAVYASHVVEHVEDVDSAMRELDRVAENVYVITPFPLWPSAWACPSHRWILWRGKGIAKTPHNYAKDIIYNIKQLLSRKDGVNQEG
jgi:hypothetical protein